MIYLDTSALVKKYVTEKGTPVMQDLMEREDLIFTSQLTSAETYAAFNRKRRERELSAGEYRRITHSFVRDWASFVVVDLAAELFPLIRRLTEAYPLRGADAVHLASALWLRERLLEPLTFVGANTALIQSAEKEGLAVLNPEQEAKDS